MLSEKNPLCSVLRIGGIGLLAFSLGACDDARVSEGADTSPTTQSARVEPAPVPAPPPPAPAELAQPEPMPHYSVHFAVGSAQLTDTALETLKSTVEYLRAHPAVQVKLSGYTDLSGPTDTNKKLAEQRVERTALFFEEQGIARSRLTTVAIGEAEPTLAPAGETPETWNRRVEIEFRPAPNT